MFWDIVVYSCIKMHKWSTHKVNKKCLNKKKKSLMNENYSNEWKIIKIDEILKLKKIGLFKPRLTWK